MTDMRTKLIKALEDSWGAEQARETPESELEDIISNSVGMPGRKFTISQLEIILAHGREPAAIATPAPAAPIAPVVIEPATAMPEPVTASPEPPTATVGHWDRILERAKAPRGGDREPDTIGVIRLGGRRG